MPESLNYQAVSMPGFEAIESWDASPHAHSIQEQVRTEVQAAANRLLSIRYQLIKRAFDLSCAAFAALLLLPFASMIALGIRLASEGPIFYREERIGRFGRPFTIFKFRTMYTKEHLTRKLGMDFTPEQLSALRTHTKGKGDPRIFPLGKLLRALSLDEVPQLLNVLRGDMSLVGPRPVVRGERDQFGHYGGSFYDLALPGISGLWQVSGRSDLNFDQRVRLDSQYAKEWGISLDMWILLKTMPAVLSKRGAY